MHLRFSSPLLLSFAFLGLVGCAPKPATTRPRPVAVTVAPGEPRTTAMKAIDVPATYSAEERAAIQTLGNAEHFGGAAVSYAGLPIPEVAALRVLLDRPSAPDTLALVLDQGTLPGQLMALSGLYFADHAAFQRRAAAYASLDTPVSVRSDGCILHHQVVPARTILQAEGAMQYTGPNDNLEGWARRNHIASNTPIVEDILGGGYPFHLAGREHQTVRD